MQTAVKLLALFIVSGSAQVTSVDKCRLVQKTTLSCLQATGDDLPKTQQPIVKWIIFSKSNVPVVKKSHLANFPELTDFHAEKCGIQKVENGAFQGLASLDWVDLSHNDIKEIDPNLFENCPKLEHFNLTGNLNLVIPKDKPFLNAPILKWLDLNGANIEQLFSATFKNLVGLKYLSLSGNKLKVLPNDVFVPLNDLSFLDLSNNQFRTLDVSNFRHMKTMALVLAGNPWKCDCDLASFMRWSKKNRISDDVRCATPESKSWKEITSLNCTTKIL